MQMQRQNRKNLKGPSQPHPAPNKTPIHCGGVETGISLRALGNHHVLSYKTRKDIHLPSTESLVGLWVGGFIMLGSQQETLLSELNATSLCAHWLLQNIFHLPLELTLRNSAWLLFQQQVVVLGEVSIYQPIWNPRTCRIYWTTVVWCFTSSFGKP